ncbi:diguanylate cyclase [Gammaproteobacteria bacterium AS21]
MISNKIKIMLFLYSILSIGFITISLFSYFNAKNSLSDQITSDTLPLIGNNIYSEIQADLLLPVIISSVMAKDTFLHNWTKDGEQDLSKIMSYLSHIESNYDTMTSFFASDTTLNYYHSTGITTKLSKSNDADSWYFKARQMKTKHEINVDHNTAISNDLMVFINYKVNDSDGTYLGITGMSIALVDVKKMLSEYQKKYNREVFFVNNLGQIQLSSSSSQKNLNLTLDINGNTLEELVFNQGTASISFIEDDHPVMLDTRYVEELDWYLMVKQLDDDYGKSIYNSLLVNLLISLLVTVIVLTLTWFTLSNYQRRLEEMAVTDKLTGLHNRQMFDPILEKLFHIANRNASPLSAIILDIDDFKLINDEYGHPFGDKILIAFANFLKKSQRDSDVLCRWGGEEFLILMPNCNKIEAQDKAKKLQQTLANQPFVIGEQTVNIEISIGIADIDKLNEDSPEKLIYRADQALLMAKRGGKNQTVLATL